MATLVTTLVLFALEREAKPFRKRAQGRKDLRIAVTGVGRKAVERSLHRLLREIKPTSAIMAGFCGALRSGLAIGNVLVPTTIVDDSGSTWPCDVEATEPLRLLTMDRMISEPMEKQRLGEQHAAAIVDMESATAARVCAEFGVPFAAIRAVSDEVDTRLSPELLTLLDGGRVSLAGVVAAILRRPTILQELLRLGRDTNRAANRLADEICNHLAS